MGLWSNYSDRYTLNLQAENVGSKLVFERSGKKTIFGNPRTIDDQEADVPRVPKEELLTYYVTDPLTFNSVNFCTTITMHPGFEILGDSQREYSYFFSRMRTVGDNTSLRRLILGLIADRVAYGAAFIEFVFDRDEKEIVDLRRVNATRIDYARTRNGSIILNRDGKPIGYVMKFGYGFDTTGKGDPIPSSAISQGIYMKSGDVFINPQRIAIFPLYKLPNDYDYLGIVEPAAESIKWRRKIQKAQVNAINIKATSPYVMTVGDNLHEPTSQMMDDADNILRHIDESKAISLPYTMKLGTVESKSLDIIESTIQALMFDQAAGAGIPLPLLTGAGEATNRATLGTQREMYEANLQSHVENFVEDWNLQVMVRLKEVNQYKGLAMMQWGEIRMESKDEQNKRFMEDITHKVFTPMEIRNHLKGREKIETNDKEYKEYYSAEKKEEPKKVEKVEENTTE